MIRSARLEGLAGSGVFAFESSESLTEDALLPAEYTAISGAVPKRIGEFAAGRACARAALAELGISGFALLNDSNRAPIWPPGVVGSISHTDGLCVAMAAWSAQVAALGVDAEVRQRVKPDVWQRICTPEEVRQLAALPLDQAAELATIFFSAKEAFYKSQHPLTNQWLNFTDVTIRIRDDEFEVLPQRSIALDPLRPGPWRGRLLLDAQRVVTLVRLD